jgi:hypothetical protein
MPAQPKLTARELIAIFPALVSRERPRRGFFRKCADALVRADEDNFLLLLSAALVIADASKEFPQER